MYGAQFPVGWFVISGRIYYLCPEYIAATDELST